MKTLILITAILFLRSFSHSLPLTETDLRVSAKSLVDSKKVAGIIITAVQPQGITTVAYGETILGNKRAPDLKSVFEIGSITKVFTGLLLAQAIAEKRLSEDQVVQDILKDFQIPSGNRKITIKDLATHSSGLPGGFDKHFRPANPLNPWADFTKTQLQALLKRTKLASQPGTQYGYSNIGAALVGYILEFTYKASYQDIVQAKILKPSLMNDTGIQLSANQLSRLVSGYYNDKGIFHPIPLWDTPGIPAAGALRSTMSDMIIFARTLIDETFGIKNIFPYSILDRAPGPFPNSRSGLFWVLMPSDGYVWHNGATYGKTSFLGINPKKKTAVIILCNSHPPAQEETVLGLSLMKKVGTN